MLVLFRSLARDTSGAMVIEYALIAAILAAASLSALHAMSPGKAARPASTVSASN